MHETDRRNGSDRHLEELVAAVSAHSCDAFLIPPQRRCRLTITLKVLSHYADSLGQAVPADCGQFLLTDQQGSLLRQLKPRSVAWQPIRKHIRLERNSNKATRKRHRQNDSDLKVIAAYLEQYQPFGTVGRSTKKDLKNKQFKKMASDFELELTTVKLKYKTLRTEFRKVSRFICYYICHIVARFQKTCEF